MKAKYLSTLLIVIIVFVVSCTTGGILSHPNNQQSLITLEEKQDTTTKDNHVITAEATNTTSAVEQFNEAPVVVAKAAQEGEIPANQSLSRIEDASSPKTQIIAKDTTSVAESIWENAQSVDDQTAATDTGTILEEASQADALLIAGAATSTNAAKETAATETLAKGSEPVSTEPKPMEMKRQEEPINIPAGTASNQIDSQEKSSAKENAKKNSANEASAAKSIVETRKSVKERDSIAAAIFGSSSVIVLIAAIVLFRKKDNKRKVSFMLFLAFIILFALFFIFQEHVFCTHEWIEATCEQPRNCSFCGKTEGEPLGHDFVFTKVTKEASCKEEGTNLLTCSRCDATQEEVIEKVAHEFGKKVATREASYNHSGTYSYYCKNCGEIYKTEVFELSAAEKEKAFKDSCIRYSYDSLARRPDIYKGSNVKLAGKVVQVMEEGNDIQLRVDITQEKSTYSSMYWYDDTILVTYTRNSNDRILEGDVIAMYGIMAGNYTYTTVLGANLTVPLMHAMYISIIRDWQYDSI